MTTGWDWQWGWRGWQIVLTIDLCDWMIGMAWGPRDFVIKPVPCVIIQIERWEEPESDADLAEYEAVE